MDLVTKNGPLSKVKCTSVFFRQRVGRDHHLHPLGYLLDDQSLWGSGSKEDISEHRAEALISSKGETGIVIFT